MPVKVEVSDRVVTLTLDRPETRNALTGDDLLPNLVTAIEDADHHAGVLIITGAGPAFSAGGNVKDMADAVGLFSGNPSEIMEKYRASIQQLTRTVAATDLVTIAAVNGPAIGAGFDLALGCDLRLGSPQARFAHTFIEMGIVPGDGGAWLLPRVVGWQKATELALTARSIGAEEAVEIGILLRLVPAEELMNEARDLAQTIAAKPLPAVRMVKRLLRQARSMDLDGFLELSAALQAAAHGTPEHSEAVTTYVERIRSRDRAPGE